MSTSTANAPHADPEGSPVHMSRVREVRNRLVAEYGEVRAPAYPDGKHLSVVRALPVLESGDGVILLRTSCPTEFGIVQQWDRVSWLLDDRLTARTVIIATGIWGLVDSRSRPDLEALFELLRQPWCHWVACADFARLVPQLASRRQQVAVWLVGDVDLHAELRKSLHHSIFASLVPAGVGLRFGRQARGDLSGGPRGVRLARASANLYRAPYVRRGSLDRSAAGPGRHASAGGCASARRPASSGPS